MSGWKKHTSVYGKAAFFLLAFLTVAALSTGTTYAYLKWSSEQPVVNTFKPESTVQPTINETFDGDEKKDVSISVGETEYTVYVRAAILAVWMNEDGDVLGTKPVKGTDYELDMGSSWEDGDDGYWYLKTSVESGATTPDLIESCRPLTAAPKDGYTLSVKVIAQTIQAAGSTDTDDSPAVTDAWNVGTD